MHRDATESGFAHKRRASVGSKGVRKPLREVRRILVKMPNWLGDAVMSLPAIDYLRRLFPGARIACLIRKNIADVARSNDTLDDVIGYEHASGLRAITRKARTIRDLRRRSFDLAVLLTNSFESALWVYGAGIPLRVGYKTDGRGFLLTHALPRKPGLVHQVESYVALCRSLGEAGDVGPPRLQIPPRDRQWADDFLRAIGVSADDLLIGLCPGAAYGPAKRWLRGGFIEVSKRIQEDHPAKFMVFGGEADLEPCSTVADGIGRDAVDLCGKTTIRELAALLGRSALVLSNDSGPLHLAAAIGTQVIGIFGPTDPKRSAPPRNCTVMKKDVHCSPCYKRECPADLRCMTSISADEVFREAARILAGRDTGTSPLKPLARRKGR